eukprot:1145947-Pelagomonas_calceolata.AAC.4
MPASGLTVVPSDRAPPMQQHLMRSAGVCSWFLFIRSSAGTRVRRDPMQLMAQSMSHVGVN